jgi:hypothetical protein
MKSVLKFLEDAHSKMTPEDFHRHFIDAMCLYELVFKDNIVDAFDAGSVKSAKTGNHYYELIHQDENNRTI